MKKAFSGIYSAIFSVYDENMDVIESTVTKMVNYQLENGLKGFYVCGNTGECTVLPEKTRKQMLEAVVKANNGRGQIIAHVGAGHFDETCRLIEHANTQPIDAIASLPPSLTPYYNPQETVEYYKKIAELSKHPVFAYITPVLRGSPVEFAKELIKIPNIAGIKLTIADYYSFGAITAIDDGAINVLNGPDETMICGLAVGADGAIGTTYNFLPGVAVAIYQAMQVNDVATALQYQRKLNKVINIGFGNNMAVWKQILAFRGFDMGYTVFPCQKPTDEQIAKLKKDLEEVGYFDLK